MKNVRKQAITYSTLIAGAIALCPTSLFAVESNPVKDVYFGTTHAHSSWSIDAYGSGNQNSGPEDGYRFARGEAVSHMGGEKVKLQQPLDFFMMTDHSEMMGTAPMMLEKGSPLYNTPTAKLVQAGNSTAAFAQIAGALANGKPLPGFGDPKLATSVWQQVVANADKYYEPGTFTTFAGYEWTSMPGAANMHRNVIFRDTKVVPQVPFTAMDSVHPEDLWSAMETWRGFGAQVMAIPHNGNASAGKMFSELDSYGNFMTKEYAERRMANEPLTEAGQIKGVSMAHPQFSPTDEFANFELWNYKIDVGHPVPAMRSNYIREAWKMGLGLEALLGVNPFKMGVEGGSDSHSTINTFEEFNNKGNHAMWDNTAKKRRFDKAGQSLSAIGGSMFLNPGTLTGVWAESNTRGPIFDAMMRKETYATSGTRIRVRFFGGYNFSDDLFKDKDWLTTAYAKGVPMGSDLPPNNGKVSPRFIVAAQKAPDGGNLDRIQIIKLWTDGVIDYEKIYDIALSDGRKVDPATGKAPTVGNTVDLEIPTYTNDIGDIQLMTVWTDPDFDASQSAVYYVRVLEIPTPRWTTFDAVALGLPPSDMVPAIIQERAWTSPIWYNATK